MADSSTPAAAANTISGNMLLYGRPELLAKEDHGHLGLRIGERPFEFARKTRAVPIVVSEFRSAQKYGPIVFSEGENPIPFAVTGLLDSDNLFVDEAGRWAVPGYVPAYLRCYPFALATAAEDRYAVVVDRDADVIGEEWEPGLFENGEISAVVQQRIDLCRNYEAEKQRTRAFCERLKELDLFTPQQAAYTIDGKEQTVARYRAVDHRKLEGLAADVVNELFRDGSLGFVFAHLYSLDSWPELVRRREARQRRG